MPVNNHLLWVPDWNSDKGKLYTEYWKKIGDYPVIKDVTFTEACEYAMTFPPRTAIKREIW